jgi:hypothetical protein
MAVCPQIRLIGYTSKGHLWALTNSQILIGAMLGQEMGYYGIMLFNPLTTGGAMINLYKWGVDLSKEGY